MSTQPDTLTTEPYGNTHALVLRSRGAVHVLFVSAGSLPASERYQACQNVCAGILRAIEAAPDDDDDGEGIRIGEEWPR